MKIDPREKNIKEFLKECEAIKTKPNYKLNDWKLWVFNNKKNLHRQFNLEDFYECYNDWAEELVLDDDEICDLYQFEVVLNRLGFLE